MKKTNGSGDGFTIIEVMIALSILMIGILGLWKLIAQNYQIADFATKRNLATREAFMLINDLRPGFYQGSVCLDCDNSGLCETIECNGNPDNFPLRIEWTSQSGNFNFIKSVGQIKNSTSSTNSTVPYVLVTATAGWGGANCMNNVSACTNNVTIRTVRLP